MLSLITYEYIWGGYMQVWACHRKSEKVWCRLFSMGCSLIMCLVLLRGVGNNQLYRFSLGIDLLVLICLLFWLGG